VLVKKFGAFNPKKNNRKDQWGPHGVLMGPHGVSMGHSEVEAAPPPPPPHPGKTHETFQEHVPGISKSNLSGDEGGGSGMGLRVRGDPPHTENHTHHLSSAICLK
jgi:hypothetical protein